MSQDGSPQDGQPPYGQQGYGPPPHTQPYGQPSYGQPSYGQGQALPAQQRPHQTMATMPVPVAYEAIAGTPYGVAILGVAPIASGPATGSLVTGVASILVSFVVGCFGAVGARNGWGPIVAGAFAVLAALLGVASLVLGRLGLRQVRRGAGWSTVTGRGLAIAGMICGGVGLLVTALSFAGAVAFVGSGTPVE